MLGVGLQKANQDRVEANAGFAGRGFGPAYKLA